MYFTISPTADLDNINKLVPVSSKILFVFSGIGMLATLNYIKGTSQ